jgi:hypothetical protein
MAWPKHAGHKFTSDEVKTYWKQFSREQRVTMMRQRGFIKESRLRIPESIAYMSSEYRRWRTLWSRYRITPEEYAARLKSQDGVCAICSRPPKERPLHVDHDHTTGEVRGLLCWLCNTIVGWVTPERLGKLKDYVI